MKKIFILLCMMMVSLCLSAQNVNNQTDEKRYVERLKELAKRGDYQALFFLGQSYLKGEGVAKDEAKGAELIKKAAANSDHPHIYWYLGFMYQAGWGVERDYAKAVEWYRKSAEKGYRLGQNRLAQMYRDGLGVKQDYAKAAELFTKAAEQGMDDAQYNLGLLYQFGNGVKKDEAKAAEWYTKAAEDGEAKADDKAKAYNQLAYLQADRGNYDAAIAYVDKAIKIDPQNADWYDSKGEFLFKKGNKSGAKAMWNKIISIDPKYSDNKTDFYKLLFPSK